MKQELAGKGVEIADFRNKLNFFRKNNNSHKLRKVLKKFEKFSILKKKEKRVLEKMMHSTWGRVELGFKKWK